MAEFSFSSVIDAPVETVFAWHARPGAFERLAPPWETIRVIEKSGGITDGSRLVMEIKVGPIPRRWTAEHVNYQENKEFTDVQVKGLFAKWRHVHRFSPSGADHCLMEDLLDYKLPFGPVGSLIGGWYTGDMLERMFRFRHQRVKDDIRQHAPFNDQPRQTIAISGASGLVGTDLTAFLTTGGHKVLRLVRRPAQPGSNEIFWSPIDGEIDAAALEGVDAIINLSGENVGAGRWNKEKRQAILRSRAKSTRILSETIAKLKKPPRVFISASAIGYYGSRGGQPLDESSPPGDGFLAEVSRAWEAATELAVQSETRVIQLRIGMVLSAKGGALAKMLTPFKMGMGGPIAGGEQYMSWISLDDLVGAINHLIFAETVNGPVNAVAPLPVTNAEFTKTLGHVLGRPAVIPIPETAIKTLFGEMGEETILSGSLIDAAKLRACQYTFIHPQLEDALRMELGKLEE